MMRVDYYKVSPGGVKALHALEQYLRASGLQPALIELVKVRASLMNGCAYCVDVHTKDARAKKPSHLLIVDPVPALNAAMTSAGQVEHVNRQVYEYRRRTLDELKTRGIADVVHPIDLPRVIDCDVESTKPADPVPARRSGSPA